ncbi:MAG: N(2)-acetyl-L-2,4-diaminobutanoate deacetylase DoeB [Rhizobiaceae bacterium]
MPRNPITSTLPFDRDGIHHGHLVLPWSRDESAWGTMRIPITVMRNGEGQCALVTGGNHGDEYEGPLAIVDFARSVRLDDVSGTIILVPFMNYPAFLAGKRTSPIDGGNMNRIFPGSPDGTTTEKIADYFLNTLLPKAVAVLDFHSGGKSLEFLPLAASHALEDEEQRRHCAAARDAFGAPWALTMVEIDNTGMYDTEAEAMGKTFVTTELGGAGTTTPETVAIAKRGLRNFLKHVGVLAGEPDFAESKRLSQPGDHCFCFAPEPGMLEPLISLGETITEEVVVARIWQTGHAGTTPVELQAKMDGILISRHVPGLVQAGDCIAVFAVED